VALLNRKYSSYSEQKGKRAKVRHIVIYVLIFFAAYASISTFVFSTRLLNSNSMQPQLSAGDRFVFSSFSFSSLLSDIIPVNTAVPFKHGNIVLLDMTLKEPQNILLNLSDAAVRFFTAQQVTIIHREERFFVKRVIGLPGDTITMTGFVFRVKPQNSDYSFTEFELSDKPYNVTIPQTPALWAENLPFSSTMETIVLGEDECFIISDDRSNTNDSRTWGAIPVDAIVGKALFRYWPLARLGVP
jgi:signal peptidase I